MQTDSPAPLLQHLKELRRVLIVSILATTAAGVVSYGVFGDQLMNLLTMPIRNLGLKLVFTTPFEAFMTQIKTSLFVGFIFSLPVVLWQLWRFILPALKAAEARLAMLFVPVSLLLFAGGAAFAYFTAFQFAIKFLLVTLPVPGLEPMIRVGEYFSFMFGFLLPFGLAFEMPLVAYVLAKTGILTHRGLKKKRKLALLAIVILGAVVTPGPDVISQFLLALPMLALYEVSVWTAYFVEKKKIKISEQQEAYQNV